MRLATSTPPIPRATLVAAALVFAMHSTASPSPAVGYQLDTDSDFEIGCQDGCACPVTMHGLQGSFELSWIGPDGDFDRYAVTAIDWRASAPGQEITITGAGEYLVGGGNAPRHRAVLDLAVDGGGIQRFDSGLVAGGEDFPAIRIAAAVHEFFCWDSVVVVRGSPLAEDATGAVAGAVAPVALAASPNPFEDATRIAWTLPAEALVHLRVYDVGGRLVRTLSAGRRHGPGPQAIAWDGRTDDGGEAPAGVYWVRLLAGGRTDVARIARVR
jgi:hypothetical protein